MKNELMYTWMDRFCTIKMNSVLVQSHSAIRFGGSLHKKQYKLFTLGTVSCFSEQDIHCFNANNPRISGVI